MNTKKKKRKIFCTHLNHVANDVIILLQIEITTTKRQESTDNKTNNCNANQCNIKKANVTIYRYNINMVYCLCCSQILVSSVIDKMKGTLKSNYITPTDNIKKFFFFNF